VSGLGLRKVGDDALEVVGIIIDGGELAGTVKFLPSLELRVGVAMGTFKGR
jgi:hypothetical protein